MITTTIDTTRLNDQLIALRDALRVDASTVVRDESRLLIKQCMAFTAPQSQAQGNKAVRRDVTLAMRPFDPSTFTKPELRDRLKAEVAKGDLQALNATVKNFPNLKTWKFFPFSEKLHESARASRGRVLSNKRIFVLEVAKWKRYLTAVLKRVGWMRSGWLPAYEAVGGVESKGWVTRHSGRRPGFVTADLTNQTSPSITIGNTARGISQFRHNAQGAIAARAQAISRRIKLIASGYSKDVAAGLRISRKAHQTAPT